MKNPYINIIGRIAILVVFVFLGCGKVVAPAGSKIIISPSSFNLTSGYAGKVRSTFVITVLDKDGNPMNSVEVKADCIWSPPYATPPPRPYIQVYDRNGNPVNVPFIFKTGVDGTYTLVLEFDTGNSYTGSLDVFSGSASASASLAVTF